MMDRTRILSFWRKPPAPTNTNGNFQEETVLANLVKSSQQKRHIPKSADGALDAPELIDDYYLNLLDWRTGNILAIALGSTVYLSNASNGSVVDLWDTTANRKLTTLQGGHQGRVGSLSWNSQILTTGGSDSMIINNDVRVRSHIVQTFRGHSQEVFGLKWSNSSQYLASGGNDNLLYIWDRMALQILRPNGFINLITIKAAVKALAWCDQFQSNLLASGGGSGDRCIKFWNINTGACLNSIDTGLQVSSLFWSKFKRELLSSHATMLNQLILWRYPSMDKIAKLNGDVSGVLFTAESPNGCTVASAGDEMLMFWNVFGTPEITKPAKKIENLVGGIGIENGEDGTWRTGSKEDCIQAPVKFMCALFCKHELNPGMH
ncbi:hypothetical protein AAC387_Pa08g1377 [Persea americana]